MKAPGPIALEAANEAEERIGITEVGGNNVGIEVVSYLRAVGLRGGQPWCAAFVRFCFEQASDELGVVIPEHFPDTGWCPSYEAWAKKRGLWTPVSSKAEPQRGDLALFWFPAKQRVAHIGIVTEKVQRSVYTVEGNTGPEKGVNREGDGVFRKRRPFAALGERGGFVRVPF